MAGAAAAKYALQPTNARPAERKNGNAGYRKGVNRKGENKEGREGRRKEGRGVFKRSDPRPAPITKYFTNGTIFLISF